MKVDDRIVYTGSESVFVAQPMPGTHAIGVAATAHGHEQSDFTGTGGIDVTQTWRRLKDVADRYPDLLPSTPVSTDGYRGMICQGTGPYNDAKNRRAIFCSKPRKDDPYGEVEFQVAVYVYANPHDASIDGWNERLTDSRVITSFSTAYKTAGSVRLGDSGSDSAAILIFDDVGKPKARGFIQVVVPGKRRTSDALSLLQGLPI